MRTRRTASLLVALAATAAVGACTFDAEPAPAQPESPDGYSTEGFPPPGPAPVPGQITPGPVAEPAPADEPRPRTGPVPTEGPQTTEAEPRPTGAEAPPPGS